MFRYGFPGNARELEKVIGAAVAFAEGGEITEEHLPGWARGDVAEAGGDDEGAAEAGADKPEDAALREELLRLFREHKGNVSAVARAMGKARMQVQRWMKRFGIDGEAFRR
jgi:transcriptional regulator of acetoin/glycerol metabolism